MLKASGGPLTRFSLRWKSTSTWSAILMNGISLFIPKSLRLKTIFPLISPGPVPLPETISVSFSECDTPRIITAPMHSI